MEEITEEKVRSEWYRSSIQDRRELGMFGLKTLMTLNSGAFVVLLTFLGNSASQTEFVVPYDAIKLAMLCFLIGIVLTFLVIAVAYLVALGSNPYTGKIAFGERLVLPAYLLLAFLSLTAFTFGVWTIVSGVQVR